MSDDDDVEVEQKLTSYFARHDRVADESVATSQSLFGLRDVDAALAELVEAEAALRDDGADHPLRFEAAGTTVVVNLMAGRIDVLIDPNPASAHAETSSSSLRIELDAASGATVAIDGVVRLRVQLNDGGEIVTDPFIVPPA